MSESVHDVTMMTMNITVYVIFRYILSKSKGVRGTGGTGNTDLLCMLHCVNALFCNQHADKTRSILKYNEGIQLLMSTCSDAFDSHFCLNQSSYVSGVCLLDS